MIPAPSPDSPLCLYRPHQPLPAQFLSRECRMPSSTPVYWPPDSVCALSAGQHGTARARKPVLEDEVLNPLYPSTNHFSADKKNNRLQDTKTPWRFDEYENDVWSSVTVWAPVGASELKKCVRLHSTPPSSKHQLKVYRLEEWYFFHRSHVLKMFCQLLVARHLIKALPVGFSFHKSPVCIRRLLTCGTLNAWLFISEQWK